MLAMKQGLGMLAAAARDWAQADVTKTGEWSVALTLSVISDRLGCEARRRAVERRLNTLGSDGAAVVPGPPGHAGRAVPIDSRALKLVRKLVETRGNCEYLCSCDHSVTARPAIIRA